MWIVYVVSYRAIFDLIDGLIDDEQRHQEPLTRDHRLSEAIFNFDVKLRRPENAVDHVFKLCATVNACFSDALMKL
jgi:hypothetical protein